MYKLKLMISVIILFTLLSACQSNNKEEVSSTVSISVESNILGLADTNNKSTLKKQVVKTTGPGDTQIYFTDDNGQRIAFDEGTIVDGQEVSYTGQATIKLASDDNIDDSEIDSSQSTIALVDGDGYYKEELRLLATTLQNEWKNGETTYTLSTGDLEWSMGDYSISDLNSGKEWSCFGGDGNGLYTFNFEVSGIKYKGEILPSKVFQIQVYIYGRDATDMAQKYNDLSPVAVVQKNSGVSTEKTEIWTWSGDGEKPILCDELIDDFFITWGTNNVKNDIKKEDVSITLSNSYGEKYLLTPEDYTVFDSDTETQIAISYHHWAFIPVYTDMTITVKNGDEVYEKNYEIASVYVYMVQTGGGGQTVDGTVVAYNYYGLENISTYSQLMNEATYILVTEEQQYYAEDSSGDGYLTGNIEEAKVYSAAGPDDCNQVVVGNMALITTRINQTLPKSIDGTLMVFNKEYNIRELNKTYEEIKASGITASKGYIFPTVSSNTMWAWQEKFKFGWIPQSPVVTSAPSYH
ncbi:TPA: hypothetical protein TY426_001130 [Streptococcus suis]|nr:hypothetical protein [Streptococcus suis]